MKKLLLLLSLACCLLFSYCKVVKYTPEKMPANQIVFGDGGGFTGTETTYILLENGQLFKQTGQDSTFAELESVPASTAKNLFDQVATLQLYKMDIDKPGNIYYYLREITEDIDSQVTWGAGDYLPPRSLIVTYKELQNIVAEHTADRHKNIEVNKTKEGKKETVKNNTDW